MPASGPRSRGARVPPRSCQGCQPWPRASAASGLVLATQKGGGITGWGTSIAAVAIQVAVIGSGREHEQRAEEVGRLLAERGCTVVTGGLGEVMAAAAAGAKRAGGTTIGILPGESRAEANEWIDHAVVTGIGHARNLAVAASGDAVIAVGGSWGTLAEIGFASRLGRRVVVLEPGREVAGVARAATPAEAVEGALADFGQPPLEERAL